MPSLPALACRRRFRRIRVLLACALSLPLFPSCGRGPTSDPTSLSAVEGAAAFDFARELPFADAWAELAELDPNRYENRRYLADGWHLPSAASSAEVRPDAFLWSRDREATIRFWLAETAPRSLTFRAHPLPLPGDPSGPATFSVSWNGRTVFEGELARRRYTVPVPVEAQVEGMNLLRFHFPWALRPVADLEGGTDLRRLSTAIGRIAVAVEDEAVARRAEDARELQPRGVAWAETPMGDQRTVEQVSASLLRFALELPPEATFRAEAIFARHAGDGPERARFRVFVTPEGGERRLLCEALSALHEPVPLEASLGALAGLPCRFDFEVRAEDSAEPVVGWWHAPRLETPAQPAAREPEPLPAPVRERLARAPVILFLFDATNPSYLSCYGGRPGLTPHFDRLAQEGTRFTRAHAQASYTIASVASTLTSRYGWEHGTWQEKTAIRPSLPTWPEAFRDAGYETRAVFCSPNGSGIFGADRGFEGHADVFRDALPEIAGADDVPPAVERILAERDRSRPLFLWVHVIEPHEPYGPPGPWAGSLTDPGYRGRVAGDAAGLWAIRRWRLDPTPEEIAHIEAQYQENLAYADHVFGTLRERLEDEGLWQDAVVGVFSDHGEGFLEHSAIAMAGMGHGSTAYDEMTRIPLILRLPEGVAPRGAVRDSLAANFDLLPTVAELVGVPPLPGGHGVSLAPELLGSPRPVRDHVIGHSASLHNGRFLPIFALWEDDWKLVYRTGEGSELYDLASDPGERHDLAATHPVLADAMRQGLRRRAGIDLDLGWDLEATGGDLEDAVMQQLEALGYGQ